MAPPPPNEPRKGERIAKLLARAGIASRREVERMIAEGRVRLNDAVLTTPATVLPDLKGVTVDGNPVRAAEAARLFRFHKPSGLITAERDPAGRPTIYAALRNALPPGTPRLMPVGRLDFNTEGLLLMTNDGELKRAMELPSSGIPRTYRARTYGNITQEQLEQLIEGVTIEGIHYGKIDANMERRTGRNQWIELTLTEGKNREVRRVLEHLGLEVSRLLRTAYGPFMLGDIPRGAANEVRPVDVERFREAMPSLARSEARDPASKKPGTPPRRGPSRDPGSPAGKRPGSPSPARRRPAQPPRAEEGTGGTAKVRIISGQWRGRKLTAPPGEATRPTADRTRETLFSMLVSRLGSFEGLAVADLFAGSGALGLEALSRGAASCTFVEQDAAALRALRANIAHLQAAPQCDVRAASVMTLAAAKQPLDLILMDPPYASGAGEVALDRLVRLGWIGPATWVSLETSATETPAVRPLEAVADRKVGKARLTLFRMPGATG